jgi:hypothetical protein
VSKSELSNRSVNVSFDATARTEPVPLSAPPRASSVPAASTIPSQVRNPEPDGSEYLVRAEFSSSTTSKRRSVSVPSGRRRRPWIGDASGANIWAGDCENVGGRASMSSHGTVVKLHGASPSPVCTPLQLTAPQLRQRNRRFQPYARVPITISMASTVPLARALRAQFARTVGRVCSGRCKLGCRLPCHEV